MGELREHPGPRSGMMISVLRARAPAIARAERRRARPLSGPFRGTPRPFPRAPPPCFPGPPVPFHRDTPCRCAGLSTPRARAPGHPRPRWRDPPGVIYGLLPLAVPGQPHCHVNDLSPVRGGRAE